MPQFTYKALAGNRELIEQTIQARSKEEVVAFLREKQLKVLSVKKDPVEISFGGNKVKTLDKANFCRYLSIMLRSGLSLSEAVEVINSETENKKMKRILQDLSFSLQEGGEISAVLERYPEVFDKVFLALVRAGEKSGSLEKTFEYLSTQLYSVHRLNKKISGALMYPAVIISAMFGVGVLMMTFVLPKLGSVFLKMKIPLPTPTRILLEFGEFMGKNAVMVILGIAVLIGFFTFLFTYHKTASKIKEILANLPVIKKLCKQIDLARFSRTLATLLQSGVPIINALEISGETLTQYDMKRVAKTFEKGVTEGKQIANILSSEKKVFPAIMVQTIKTGEKTGTLDTVLMEIADYYESELEDGLKEFTTLLEPLIMLIIGVAVGAMVIMIIAPIYSVLGGMQAASGGGK
jgi:type IV pilus assembly protein PilC